jgi:proteasome lid subunit RPN8/RPN11
LEGTEYTPEEARRAVSKQRRLESGIRADKREKEALEALGLDSSDASRRLRAKQKQLRGHIKEHPGILRRERHRESIYAKARAKVDALGTVHLDEAQKRRVLSSYDGMMVEEPNRVRREGVSKRTEKVDIGFIDSPEYRKAFDFFDDEELGDVVCGTARDMLKHRTGTTLEDFAAVSLSGKSVVTKLTSAATHKRAMLSRENIRCLLEAKRGDLVAIHNHPESSPPSFADFRICTFRSIRYGLIACHDGGVVRYRITNRELFNETVSQGKGGEVDSFLGRNMVYYGTSAGDRIIADELERRFGISYERLS